MEGTMTGIRMHLTCMYFPLPPVPGRTQRCEAGNLAQSSNRMDTAGLEIIDTVSFGHVTPYKGCISRKPSKNISKPIIKNPYLSDILKNLLKICWCQDSDPESYFDHSVRQCSKLLPLLKLCGWNPMGQGV